jgi:hypothetical protein
MCAIPDKATTERWRARTATQRAYKVVIQSNAGPMFHGRHLSHYRCGRNVDTGAARSLRGLFNTQRGLYCYLHRKDADRVREKDCIGGLTVVAITFEPRDVIAVDKESGWGSRQIVVRALHITKRAWKQAGLPATKGGGA